VIILQEICEKSKMAVRVEKELGEWFQAEVGTKQGDPLSPTLFITYLERVMDTMKELNTGVSIHGQTISNLKFADDVDLLDSCQENLQRKVTVVDQAGRETGLKMNISKTKTMVFGRKEIDKDVEVRSVKIENVEEFEYLGSLLTWDNDCSKDIRRRIAKATGVSSGFGSIWKSKQISIKVKMSILRTCVFSVFMYACETWTLRKADRDRILAFEMRCYRRMLGIKWQQKITNVEIRKRLAVKKNLLQEVMGRKLTLFGHICRMNDGRMVKDILFGMMDGKSRRGRPSREWFDDIRECCGLDAGVCCIKARDKIGWKKIVQESALWSRCARDSCE
ncbi:MAG TPA: reverse transcriptase domain-containing protein, partial [Leptospiraceae bacterium]|nr:reverse transcriptase domain-containing protein [Leptospiraceae bacterium]